MAPLLKYAGILRLKKNLASFSSKPRCFYLWQSMAVPGLADSISARFYKRRLPQEIRFDLFCSSLIFRFIRSFPERDGP